MNKKPRYIWPLVHRGKNSSLAPAEERLKPCRMRSDCRFYHGTARAQDSSKIKRRVFGAQQRAGSVLGSRGHWPGRMSGGGERSPVPSLPGVYSTSGYHQTDPLAHSPQRKEAHRKPCRSERPKPQGSPVDFIWSYETGGLVWV